MPHYQSNESPENTDDGETFVDIEFEKIKVLEVNERNNKITFLLSQYMEWDDPRIKANFSAMPNGYTKLSTKNMKEIWHPDIDMFTVNINDWASLYAPRLFQMVGVGECPELRTCDFTQDTTSFYAYKDWRVTVFCEFDFSSFPLDTQRCEFLQTTTSDTLYFRLNHPTIDNNKTKRAHGFEINITYSGTFINYNDTTQNGTQTFGFNITLERMIQPYLYQYYFPCIAIVVVSQISFVIPLSAIPGRVALVVTQFLTLTNLFIHQMVSNNTFETSEEKTMFYKYKIIIV